MATSFIILAAGLGSRLGGTVPKPLTVLEDGRTILDQQLANLIETFGPSVLESTTVVIGHRGAELIAELPRSVKAVLNADYRSTGTARSLALGLASVPHGNGALWLNGDVVFQDDLLQRALPLIAVDHSFSIVVEGATEADGVQYTLGPNGMIQSISKSVEEGLGEAVGINYVSARDLPRFLEALRAVGPEAPFQVAMESTMDSGMAWIPLCAEGSYAVEVDFIADLERANRLQHAS